MLKRLMLTLLICSLIGIAIIATGCAYKLNFDSPCKETSERSPAGIQSHTTLIKG